MSQVSATVTTPFTALNTAEGGTSGVTVTTGNSGGASGRAFDAVDIIGAGASVIFDNTHTAHGSEAYQFQTGAVSALARVQWNSFGFQPQVWFRTYVYLTALPAATIRLVNADNGTTACAVVVLLTTGKLQVRTGAAGTQTLNSTNTVPLNQWFRIEGYCFGDPVVGQVELKLFLTPDSVTPDETKTSPANVNTFGTMNHLNFGVSTNAPNVAPFWEDDLGFSNVGYLGPGTPPSLLVPSAASVTAASTTLTAPNQVTAAAGAITTAAVSLTTQGQIVPAATASAQVTLTLTVPGVAFFVPAAGAVSRRLELSRHRLA